MAQNFIQHGDVLQLPAAPYDLAPGDGGLIGSVFGVSQNESESGTECVLAVVGVHRVLKVLTDVFAIGAPVYWDDTFKACTSTATGHARIGVATAAAANTHTTVDVRLHGAW